MPKAILEFNLPEESPEFKLAVNAGEYMCALNEFSQRLRQIIKYDEKRSEEEMKVFEEVRDMFFEIVNQYDIEF